jgi:hypothetical protein
MNRSFLTKEVQVRIRNCIVITGLALSIWGCQKGTDKDNPDKGNPLIEKLSGGIPTKMTFNGTVIHGISGKPIPDAKVNFIKLLDATAIQKLIEYKKAPDGKGGSKNIVRVKLGAVHAYTPDHSVTADANGKFTWPDAEINTYLVYTYGPGAQPGATGAYTVNFWGIEPETGELKLEKLIGYEAVQAVKSGKVNKDTLTFTNDTVTLAGGPAAPEPAPPPAPPPPPPPPAVEPVSTNPTPPTAVDTAKPEETVPPKPANAWTSIKLTHGAGTLATGGTLSAEVIDYPTGQNYFLLEGELATDPANLDQPGYVVIQAGFDSADTKDCADRSSSAKTYVYPVKMNGKLVEFKLVRPHTYFKVFLAKTAKKEEGKPVEATDVSDTLTVGTRKCEDAIPKKPFLATLTWDQDQADMDLHVTLLNSKKVKEEAQLETTNFISPIGQYLQLDVDNVYGYGPENTSIKDPTTYDGTDRCYAVMVHYYAGAKAEVNAKVDVQYVTTVNGRKEMQSFSATKKFTKPGSEYQDMMIVPPDCVLGPPPTAVAPPPAATELTCDSIDSTAFTALGANDARFYATGNIGDETVTFQTSFAKTEKTASQDYSPGSNGKYSATFSVRDAANKFGFNTWLYRLPVSTTSKKLTIGTDKSAEDTQNMTFNLADNSVIAKSPNAYGSSKKACGFSGATSIVTSLERHPTKERVLRTAGCFDFAWEDTAVGGADCKKVKIKGRYKLKLPD